MVDTLWPFTRSTCRTLPTCVDISGGTYRTTLQGRDHYLFLTEKETETQGGKILALPKVTQG